MKTIRLFLQSSWSPNADYDSAAARARASNSDREEFARIEAVSHLNLQGNIVPLPPNRNDLDAVVLKQAENDTGGWCILMQHALHNLKHAASSSHTHKRIRSSKTATTTQAIIGERQEESPFSIRIFVQQARAIEEVHDYSILSNAAPHEITSVWARIYVANLQTQSDHPIEVVEFAHASFALDESHKVAEAMIDDSNDESLKPARRMEEKEEEEEAVEEEDNEEQERKSKKPRFSYPSAASPISTRVSLFSRIDLDSLSICFSFLNAYDFLSAVRVSRQWRAARVKRSAWPRIHLPSLIHSLQTDDYDNLNNRRLFLSSSKHIHSVCTTGSKCMWKNASDVRLAGASSLVTQMVGELASNFTQLAALTLIEVNLTKPQIHKLINLAAERLQMLGLARCKLSIPLIGQLTQLRVLVLDCYPCTEQLMQLELLQYLHFRCNMPGEPQQLGHTIRWLSIKGQLRSLSLEYFIHRHRNHRSQITNLLLTNEQPDYTGLSKDDVQQLERMQMDWSKDQCQLTDLSITAYSLYPSINAIITNGAIGERLDQLPMLQRLDWNRRDVEDYSDTSRSLLGAPILSSIEVTLSHLQELSLFIDTWNYTEPEVNQPHYLTPLCKCEQLRTVRITFPHVLSSHLVCSLFSAWSNTIEEARITTTESYGHMPTADTDVTTATDLQAFQKCNKLRILGLSLEKNDILEQLPSLGALKSLEWFPEQLRPMPNLPALFNMLRLMGDSSNWNILHIYYWFGSHPTLDQFQQMLKKTHASEERQQKYQIFWQDGQLRQELHGNATRFFYDQGIWQSEKIVY